MKLLLDTCTFLWVIGDSKKLSLNARELFLDTNNEIYLSVISVWEIMIKFNIKRLPLPKPPQEFITNERKRHGIETLQLEESAIWQLNRLPDYHRDPFDRMLIAQAIALGAVVLTSDQKIVQYPVRTIW